MSVRVGEVNVFADFLDTDVLVEHIAAHKRLTEFVVAEAAARALDGLFALAVAVNHALDALGGDSVGVIAHFHKDESAVSAVRPVYVQHRVRRRARTGKGVENDGVRVRC